jgi:hypothetical protein
VTVPDVLLSKHSGRFRADVVVVNTVLPVTTESTQPVSIDSLLNCLNNFIWGSVSRVVMRAGVASWNTLSLVVISGARGMVVVLVTGCVRPLAVTVRAGSQALFTEHFCQK